MQSTFLRLTSKFSLDVALSAAVLSFILTRFFNLSVHYAYYILLSLATLCIYSFDHTVDTINDPPPEKPEEVTTSSNDVPGEAPLHLRYRNIFLLSLGLTLILAYYICRFLPNGTLIVIMGGLLTLIITGYFYILIYHISFLTYTKELIVTFIFTLALFITPVAYLIVRSAPPSASAIIVSLGFNLHPVVLTPPLSYLYLLFTSPQTLLGKAVFFNILKLFIVYYSLLVHNAVLFSYNHFRKDQLAGRDSVIIKLGKTQGIWLINSFGFLTLILILYTLQSSLNFYKYYFVVAIIIQALLLRYEVKLRWSNRFEIIGDGYFIVLFLVFYAVELVFSPQ